MKHPHRVVLLAGPSGSGKSYIAQRTGLPVLCLDDFYKDGDDPTLPRENGVVDWESPRSWDAAAAVATITHLAREGRADVPVYAIGEDRRVTTRPFEVADSPLFVAEGIFAAEIVEECRRRGVLAGAYALRRPRGATFVRRLARDLAEQRKAPGLLVRRGLTLLRAEPAVLRRQTGLGAEAARAGEVLRGVAGLLAGHPHRS
ncbi:ATP-binding protein [Micromonospora peucetia]|uniref:Uridine kinase n=1 Tax=Micromonospora peucetia TaxID=47871 RepID=A0A1C6UHZ0_9ACTN|nr:ATP-binding protein [Micromonospora peucetia]MCX4386758.1 ATP-binding protein [Micromonospora peucetia]SCL53463.1 uridine kinase [Micromonospora peucetia]